MKNAFVKIIFIGLLVSTPLFAKVYDFTEGNKLTLLQDARASVQLKLELIKNAKHHIHIMTYFWDKSGYPMEMIKELKKAHQRGVDIRILTTNLPSLAMDFWNTSEKELFLGYDVKNSESTLAFLKLSPGQNESLINNVHEKIFLVDGEKAILGGRNITDKSYVAKDLEVVLEGSIVNQVQEHFKKMFSFLQKLNISKICKDQDSLCMENVARQSFADDDVKYFPIQPHYEGGARARILTNEVLFAQHKNGYSTKERLKLKDDIIDTIININFTKLRAYNYFIIPTDRYKDFLMKNILAGKEISIITNSKASAASISDKGYLYSLPVMLSYVENGINLYQWQGDVAEEGKDQLFYLHEKVMLFDDDHGIIGSHNFGVGSTSVSSEISVEFYSQNIVKILNDVFDSELTSKLTKQTNSSLLENEILQNKKMIKLLHSPVFSSLVKEIY
ncbi:MAG: phosphatidylserine/phosphatidylglycerophosphate/cardiolipin synthase family protein [Bacteriovorax sp.]|nr:phosphatidylserine/phosphatidylglycerophosphate/cardiolipin synthase family protein [Bacteriovorax sp.]